MFNLECIIGYKPFIEELKSGKHFSRLGKTFATRDNYYFLDTGTGKVLQTNQIIHDVLNALLTTNEFDKLTNLEYSDAEVSGALEQIKEAVQTENILKAPILTTMVGPQTHSLAQYVNHRLRQVTLELTERCNLRCKYCIYSEPHADFREFGTKDMSEKTALNAIDHLYECSSEESKVYLGFYGGEPLLKFDLLKRCVEYAQERFKNKELSFSMTSNLTLLTQEKAEYFASLGNFTILASIDGPKEIHDASRVFPDGTGSFSAAMRGLRYALDAYKDTPWKIMFSSVLTPHEYDTKIKKMQNFIKETTWIPDDIQITLSHQSIPHPPTEYTAPYVQEEHEYFREFEMHVDPVVQWHLKQIAKSDEFIFTEGYINKTLYRIHDRPIQDKPISRYALNGCCVPCSRRTYVTADGDILPCEKVGSVPPVGNVNNENRVNIELLQKFYVDDYIRESIQYCSECWAVNICGQCYVNCYDSHGVNFGYRHNTCRYTRFSIYDDLITYHELLEHYPQLLEPLIKMKTI